MVLLLAALAIGGAATFVALLPLGLLVAILAAPFGASLLAAIAGAGLAYARAPQNGLAGALRRAAGEWRRVKGEAPAAVAEIRDPPR